MPVTNEPTNRYSVIIADDHELVIRALQSFLAEGKKYQIVGVAKNGHEAISLVKRHSPDIVVLDISMPDMNGIDAAKAIKSASPDTHIIIYSISTDSKWVLELLKSGISAYVIKDEPLSNLVLALDTVTKGASYFSVPVRQAIVDFIIRAESPNSQETVLSKLSKREFEIFMLLADGDSTKEIANKLYISPRTVEKHKYAILKKLDIASQSDLTKLAIKEKLVKV